MILVILILCLVIFLTRRSLAIDVIVFILIKFKVYDKKVNSHNRRGDN